MHPTLGRPETGLRFKPRFTPRLLESGDVALLSAQKTIVLSGPEYAALQPLLDGSRNADVLADCLSGQFPPERIYYALERLRARGVLATEPGSGTMAAPEPAPHIIEEAAPLAPIKHPTPPHVHVYSATMRQTLFSRIETGVLVPPVAVAGWGRTEAEARVRCLAEAAERRAGMFMSSSIYRCSSLNELEGEALSPGDLTLFSGQQYAHRQRLNATNEGMDWIPDRYEPELEIDWAAAWSLTYQRRVWLPAAYCFYAHAQHSDGMFCIANSTGCAAGRTFSEAVVRGLYELVERDACAIWWYNRLPRPEIDASSFGDQFFPATTAALRDHGRSLKIFDLTHDLGLAVVAAVSWRTSDMMGLRLGCGAHSDFVKAATQASGELNQQVFANDEATAREPVPPHLMCALPQESGNTSPYRDGGRHHGESLDTCVDRLRARGREVIVLNQSEPKSEFHVARIVIPGLRQTGARFAPGRLYDVPVKLGWRAEEAHEKELWDAATLTWPEE